MIAAAAAAGPREARRELAHAVQRNFEAQKRAQEAKILLQAMEWDPDFVTDEQIDAVLKTYGEIGTALGVIEPLKRARA